MSVKTVAIIITRENYPVAMATLPPAFALFGMNEVLNKVLVLNEPRVIKAIKVQRRAYQTRETPDGAPQEILAVENRWMTKKKFYELYRVIGTTDTKKKLSKLFFYEVEKKTST